MRSDRRDDDLFDEARLRRALRLEVAELPSRIDVAAIAAEADASRPAFVAASLMSTVVAGLAGAALVSLAAAALPAVAPALASELWSAALWTVARVAVPVMGLLAVAQQPAVPMSALAMLSVAIVFEYVQRRERLHAAAS